VLLPVQLQSDLAGHASMLVCTDICSDLCVACADVWPRVPGWGPIHSPEATCVGFKVGGRVWCRSGSVCMFLPRQFPVAIGCLPHVFGCYCMACLHVAVCARGHAGSHACVCHPCHRSCDPIWTSRNLLEVCLTFARVHAAAACVQVYAGRHQTPGAVSRHVHLVLLAAGHIAHAPLPFSPGHGSCTI
jgi:hypothetical protein